MFLVNLIFPLRLKLRCHFLFLPYVISISNNGKSKKSIVVLREYYQTVGSKEHEPLFMPSLPFAVKREWHLKGPRTEPYVRQMGDGVILFLGAMVRKKYNFQNY